MAPLKLSQPAADTPPSAGSFADLIAAEDWPQVATLYEEAAATANGDVKLGPANLGGGLYLSGLTRTMLKRAPVAPADAVEARRLVVLVDQLPECDPTTTIVFGFGEGHDAVWAKQIEGPAEDGVLACALIHRWLGTTPCLLPDVPLVAANDNDPAAPLAIDTVPLPAMAETPFEPDAAGGLLADIARWITATAIVPVPELSMVSALALLAGCTGAKVLAPTGCGVNLYLGSLMATAGGKGHPPKAARALAMAAGLDGAVSNGDPTSYAALERILRRNISTALVLDELGLTLQDVNGRNKTAASASIRKFLLAVYDQANGAFDGRQYAQEETKKTIEPLKGPALTILGMTTPETLYDGLSPSSIEDGFLNRMVWVEARRKGDVRPPDLSTPLAPPRDLVAALSTAVASLPKLKGNIAAVIGKARIPFEGGLGGPAHEAWNAVFLWQLAASEGDKQTADLIGRAAENTIRIATLRAISRCPSEPAVSVDDVAWGWAIVKTSIDTIRSGVAHGLAQTPFQRLCNLLRDHIEAAGAKGLHHSTLLRRKGVGAEDDRAVEGALRRLVQMGDITTTGLVGARSRYTFARLRAGPAKAAGSQDGPPSGTSAAEIGKSR